MKSKSALSVGDVRHIAKLANLNIPDNEEDKFTLGFNETLNVVNKLFEVNVSGVKPVSHITNLFNVFREDKIDENRMLTQDEALSNAKTEHKGFFVVDRILEA